MASKELRKLNRKELLQMLLVQCEETERIQGEMDETNARMAEMEESYERLKIKLNIKDQRLNEKDAQIEELKQTIEDMKTSREIELAEAGSIAEAALKLNGIFETAQKCADQYLTNVRKLCEKESRVSQETSRQQAARRRTLQAMTRREFQSVPRGLKMTGTDAAVVKMPDEGGAPLTDPGGVHE
ncbi:MAG: hypothetical protein HFG99_10210 [Dorea sp.]|jgi:chromosome segregation ATPase|nr:hypothetical protein [Dorea sp.]